MSFLGNFLATLDMSPITQGDIPIESPIASPRPTLPQGPIDLGGITGTVSGNVPSSSVQQPSGSLPQPPSLDTLTSIPGTAASSSPTNSAQTSASSIPTWLLSSRFVSGAVGFACIIAGLLMFKGTQQIVVNTAKNVAKTAAVA